VMRVILQDSVQLVLLIFILRIRVKVVLKIIIMLMLYAPLVLEERLTATLVIIPGLVIFAHRIIIQYMGCALLV